MEIRSVTLFCDPDFDPELAARFYAAARTAFAYPVQTVRLALPPSPDWWKETAVSATNFAVTWQTAEADYVSLGPVRLEHDSAWVDRVPALLAATGVLFASIEIGDENGRIDLHRILHTANVVKQVSPIQPNGFGNLYGSLGSKGAALSREPFICNLSLGILDKLSRTPTT